MVHRVLHRFCWSFQVIPRDALKHLDFAELFDASWKPAHGEHLPACTAYAFSSVWQVHGAHKFDCKHLSQYQSGSST